MMTTITQYIVDAFTDKVFAGNPAAVCLLENGFLMKLYRILLKKITIPKRLIRFRTKTVHMNFVGLRQAAKSNSVAMPHWERPLSS